MSGSGASSKKTRVMFVITQDWFFLSHFRHLADMVNSDPDLEGEIITTVGADGPGLEALGLEVHDVDFRRSSFSLLSSAGICLKIASVLRRRRPDIVHFIALKPIFTGGFASLLSPGAARVFHVTGMGYMADGKGLLAGLRRNVFFRLLAFLFRRPGGWLLVENPDDLEFLGRYGVSPRNRVGMLGGAGVDPDHYHAMPELSPPPVAAFVGRMIWSKGVDVLVAAGDLLHQRSVALDIELYGEPDLANPNAITLQTIEEWNMKSNLNWHGSVDDVRRVWRQCDICVVPTRTREGMPRAMLEAASCARALIVADVPGCRHFVRHGTEGLVVPPNDPVALADALQKLALDPALRQKMGRAARRRVLQFYTQDHVRKGVSSVYEKLISPP